MSQLKNDDSALSPNDLVFILAIAKHIDVQPTVLAEELDKSRHIYYAYSVLDALSSSYSMFKYFFDVYFAGSSDEMHDLMLSPAGIIGITLESLFLVSFSFFGSYFDDDKPGTYTKRIADAWPFFRDVMKGLKNAFKGWRSTVVAMSLMGMIETPAATALILPIGLALGVLGAANRFLIRSLREKRKAMMAHNNKLAFNLSKLSFLSADNLEEFYRNNGGPIQYQTDKERYLGFLAAGIGGLVDGLYLYAGALILTALAPSLLITLASICAFYTLACIVTRIYEEYEYQQKLKITQTIYFLVTYTKQIQNLYDKLITLEKKLDKTNDDLLKIRLLKKDLGNLIGKFDEQRQLLHQQIRKTYLSSILTGLKDGLYAYGALSSILFFISSILIIAGVAFPPVLIAAVVSFGLVLIAGFIANSLLVNKPYQKEQKTNEEPYNLLLTMKKQFEEELDTDCSLTSEELNDALKSGLSINKENTKKTYFFQEWFEVIRSLFSGFTKGQKFVDFVGNPLQEVGSDGHYQDTPIMYVLGGLSALLFGFTLSLRALAKGLGRVSLDNYDDLATAADIPEKTNDLSDEPQQSTATCSAPNKTKIAGESIHSKERNDSPEKTTNSLQFLGFFNSKNKHFNRPRSANDLTDLTSEQHTIQGLN